MALLLSVALMATALTSGASAASGLTRAGVGMRLPGDENWLGRYDGTGKNDYAVDLAVSPSGVFVTGLSSSGSPSWIDYGTVGYKASTGVEIWRARYNDPVNGDDEVAGIAATPDGSKVFVTGQTDSASNRTDYTTVAYNGDTGAQLWVAVYTRYDYADGATAIAVNPSGGTVYVTGWSRSAASGVDFATVAYDANTGGQLWVNRFDGPGHGGDYGRAIAVSPDGTKVFIAGETYSGTIAAGNSGNDYAVEAIDAADGERLWFVRDTGPGSGPDVPAAIAVSPAGDKVAVTGHSYGTTSNDCLTVVRNAADGSRVWAQRYAKASSGFDSGRGVGFSPDGTEVLVAGESYGGPSHRQDIVTIAYATSNGDRDWVRRYDGPNDGLSAPDNDRAWGLAVNPDLGRVYVTGATDSYDDDFATFAYAIDNGTTVWSARFDGAENAVDYGIAVGVSPDGTQAFVAGSSQGSSATSFDYGSAAYGG